MKRFQIPADFGGVDSPFDIYVGEPCPDRHPLRYQMDWLRRTRGGALPAEVVKSFQKLHVIAKENNVSFEELCVYALGEAQKDAAVQDQEAKPRSGDDQR